MKKLLDVVIRAVLRYVALWLEAKRAERLEVKIKQMESRNRAKEVQDNLIQDLDKNLDIPLTPADWNAGRKLPIILLCFVLVGCCKYVEGAWPYIPEPARPMVSTDTAWSAREETLVEYIARLEYLIEGYNDQAAQHNRTYGHRDLERSDR